MIPSKSNLIRLKVKYTIHENEFYFDIDELRQKFPDLRFPPDKIKEVFIGGVSKKGIKQEDIHELTDFEKKVIKLYNFKK